MLGGIFILEYTSIIYIVYIPELHVNYFIVFPKMSFLLKFSFKDEYFQTLLDEMISSSMFMNILWTLLIYSTVKWIQCGRNDMACNPQYCRTVFVAISGAEEEEFIEFMDSDLLNKFKVRLHRHDPNVIRKQMGLRGEGDIVYW